MKIKKIINYDQIEKVLKKHKNKKIVQCHGVFDLLHIGHLRHFENAKKIGDILIVSLTADQYIEKGFNRPFFKNQHRLESLSLIENIDYVVLNNSKSAVNIISKIKPDFYCKGQDYKNLNDDITGEIKNEIREVKKNGGKIVFTNDITFSSSSILNNIASPFGDYQNKFINSIKKKNYTQNIGSKIKQLQDLKVLIIGETIIDQYVFCEALGKSGKEPHLALRDLYQETYLGGVVAIARNLSTFCKKITILSSVGDDKKLNFIKKNLSKNIFFKYFIKSNSPTIIKKRFIEHISKNKVLGVYSLNDELLNSNENLKFTNMINKEVEKYDVVLVSDYGHGLITESAAKLINKKAKFLALNAQANAANVGYHTIQKYKNIDCVVMNEQELRQELRDKNQKIEVLAKKLSDMLKIKYLVITRGSKGAFLFESLKRNFYYSPAFATKVVDKVGAGDTMLSIISLLIKLKADHLVSLFLGSLAGAISVEGMSNKNPLNKTKFSKYIQHILK